MWTSRQASDLKDESSNPMEAKKISMNKIIIILMKFNFRCEVKIKCK